MSTYLKLHFISGKYQGGTYLLGDGEAVSIGRGNDVTLTLFEEMVSRRHVEFVNDEGTAHVKDLGSKNGTFVNGERIKKAELALGDRILIGTSIVRVEEAAAHEVEAEAAPLVTSFEDRKKAEQEAQKMTLPPGPSKSQATIVSHASLEALSFDESNLDSDMAESKTVDSDSVDLDALAVSGKTAEPEPVMALDGAPEPVFDEEPTMEPVMAAGNEDEDLGGLAAAALAALDGADGDEVTVAADDEDFAGDLVFEGEEDLADLAAAALEALTPGAEEGDTGADEPLAVESSGASQDAPETGTEPIDPDEDVVFASLDPSETNMDLVDPDEETALASLDTSESEMDADATDEEPVEASQDVAETDTERVDASDDTGGAVRAETMLQVPIPCQAPLDLLNGRQLSLWQNAMVGTSVAGLAESMGLSVDDVLDDIKVLIDGGYVEIR